MADINVLVIVDTKNITQDNVEHTVVLVDDNLDKDKKEGDSKTFTIKARNGDEVQFRIIAVDGITQVSFEQFQWEKKEGSLPLFQPLPYLPNQWTGTAIGEKGQSENFTIVFNIEGNVHNPFKLDPDLEIDPGT